MRLIAYNFTKCTASLTILRYPPFCYFLSYSSKCRLRLPNYESNSWLFLFCTLEICCGWSEGEGCEGGWCEQCAWECLGDFVFYSCLMLKKRCSCPSSLSSRVCFILCDSWQSFCFALFLLFSMCYNFCIAFWKLAPSLYCQNSLDFIRCYLIISDLGLYIATDFEPPFYLSGRAEPLRMLGKATSSTSFNLETLGHISIFASVRKWVYPPWM